MFFQSCTPTMMLPCTSHCKLHDGRPMSSYFLSSLLQYCSSSATNCASNMPIEPSWSNARSSSQPVLGCVGFTTRNTPPTTLRRLEWLSPSLPIHLPSDCESNTSFSLNQGCCSKSSCSSTRLASALLMSTFKMQACSLLHG